MAGLGTSRKRKASEGRPSPDEDHESDEIVLSTNGEKKSSRTPLEEIRNNSHGARKPSTKRRRIVDYVLIQHAPVSPLLSSPLAQNANLSFKEHSSPPAVTSHDRKDQTPLTASNPHVSHATPEATQSSRPQRAKARRSYVPEHVPFEDESEDELNGLFPPPRVRKKRVSSDAASEASDFQDLEQSAESEHESESATESDDDVSMQDSEDNLSEEEKPRKGAEKLSVSKRHDDATESKSKPGVPPKTRMAKLIKKKGRVIGLDLNAPPLSDIGQIFFDITNKALDLGLDKVVKSLHDRPLRVATMCSGTESPLLAIQMMQSALKTRLGCEISIEHLFSAEIVPFKQAYIDRNFHPRLIFRDITEFMSAVDEEIPMATTAFGGKEALPMNPDIIIAGTSCVDMSGLNNHKKTFEEEGESGDTWNAALAYCRKARPSIVILENIGGAPWDAMLEDYEAAGYEVAGVLVDSKDFYIPQTRQRGYMVCFDKKRLQQSKVKGAGTTWIELMEKFKRYASSPATSFLLPNDQVEANETHHVDDQKREIDWARCKVTQAEYRLNNGYGVARPVTNWNEDGSRLPPDYQSRAWHHHQVERVSDTIDVILLRKAHPENGNYDVRFKTRIVDLSQNVYRQLDTVPFGIQQCITPTALYFLSDAGRAMLPHESLLLQGLPLSNISFTTETPSELQSLAGNAMTTTVVGSAIAAALIASHGILDAGPQESSAVQQPVEPSHTPLATDCCESVKTISGTENVEVAPLIPKLKGAMRRCYCEASTGLATAPLQQCDDCGHTTCVTCGGNPKHNYRQVPGLSQGRLRPDLFEAALRSIMPLRIKFDQLHEDTINLLRSQPRSSSATDKYFDLVENTTKEMFTMSSFRRTHCLTLLYKASNARLELVMDDDSVKWHLFVYPPKELAANDELRQELAKPVAVSVVSHYLFGSQWSWRIPSTKQVGITICGRGEKQPAWLSRLQLPEYKDCSQWETFQISIPDSADAILKRKIEGSYTYRPHCGTANDSLYVKDTSEPGRFLFLDPSCLGNPQDDCFVFSTSISRLEYNETRLIDARIPSWRPWKQEEDQVKAELEICDAWVKVPQQLRPLKTTLRIQALKEFAKPDSPCDQATAIFSFDVAADPSHTFEGPINMDNHEFFSKYAWAFEALRRHRWFDQWHDFQHAYAQKPCPDCAPSKPSVKWSFNGKEVLSYPDPTEATRYERALKARVEALVLRSHKEGSKANRISLGVKLLSLAHRAFSRLPHGATDVRFKWKICAVSASAGTLPRFRLDNTQKMQPYERDLECSLTLFPSQKTSLTWMRQQESGKAQSCIVEESEEALIPHLGLRVEMRAIGGLTARGGICADHPGFGKTITTLALIQSRFLDLSLEQMRTELKDRQHGLSKGLFASPATLIILPHSLISQWKDEIQEKLGYEYGVYTISTVAGLSKLTIEDIQNAKIVCISAGLMVLEKYIDALGAFAGLPLPSSLMGRAFSHWLSAATRRIPEHISIMEASGVQGLRKIAKTRYEHIIEDETLIATVPSQRLRGKNYVSFSKKISAQAETKLAKVEAPSFDREIKTVGKPLLHLFQWDRIVVDEFHGYEPNQLIAIRSLQADKRWGLSGTPAMDDAYDVASTARLVGIPLRIGTDTKGTMKATNIKSLRQDMTPAELFYAMRQKHSPSVECRIREVGQGFLDAFVRRNVEKFEQIKCEEYLVPVQLTLSHRAMYAELLQDSISKGMRKQMSSLSKSNDRDYRISRLLNYCDTTEQALAKLALHQQTCSEQSPEGLPSDISSLIAIRQAEHDEEIAKMRPLISDALSKEPKTFEDWKQAKLVLNGLGDPNTVATIQDLCVSGNDNTDIKPGSMKDGREMTSKINTLAGRLAVANRSLRFLKNAQALYEATASKPRPTCVSCQKARKNIAVSANCGHVICSSCYDKMTSNGTSVCPIDNCTALIRDYNLVWAEMLTKCPNSVSSPYGAKMEAVASILKDVRKQDEQAILFVQYENQLREVEAALEHFDISAIVVTDVKQAGNQIKDFREDADNPWKKRTVLVLNQSAETAAGFNIQNANHIIFLGPLLRETQYDYDSTMAQAVGRVRRHGQKRDLHIWRIIALNTIDVDILEHRELRCTAISEEGRPEIKPPKTLAKLNQKDGELERMQLVCENGKYSLRPKSWLVKCGADQDEEEMAKSLKDKSRVLGWESFSAGIKFSKVYTENDG